MKRYLILLYMFSNIAFATLQKDLEKAFESMNTLTNVTPAYEAQSVGYYSGGSMYARTPVRNQNIAHITLPEAKAGCGGIDMHLGGFSFIKQAEMKQLAKSIMADSVTYGFNIALETVSPMIANNYKDLRNVINSVNNMNINSCETAVGLVGAVFPKTEESQRQVCQSLSNQSKSLFSDYATARMECSDPASRKRAFEDLKNKPGYDNYLLGDMNFAWKAIMSNPLFSNDDELSRVMMSVSGTIIYKSSHNGKPAEKQILPSLAISEDFINALMVGGDLKAYECDEKIKCLSPRLDNNTIIKIAPERAFVGMVRGKLESITRKIRSITEELSASEKQFINSTSLPIYKLLNVNSAFSKGISALDISTYSELIASDILYKYLEESLNEISTKAKMLQLPSDDYNQFIGNIEMAKQTIRNRKLDTFNMRAQAIQMIETSMMMEKRLAQNLEPMFKDAMSLTERIQG